MLARNKIKTLSNIVLFTLFQCIIYYIRVLYKIRCSQKIKIRFLNPLVAVSTAWTYYTMIQCSLHLEKSSFGVKKTLCSRQPPWERFIFSWPSPLGPSPSPHQMVRKEGLCSLIFLSSLVTTTRILLQLAGHFPSLNLWIIIFSSFLTCGSLHRLGYHRKGVISTGTRNLIMQPINPNQ